MKKAKFWSIAGILLAAMMIMGGCGGGSTPGGQGADVSVTGLTLSASPNVTTIYFNTNDEQTALPTSVTLTATIEPSNASNKGVNWTPDSSDFVNFAPASGGDSAITVTGKAEGEVTITVKSAANSLFSRTHTIKVVDAANYTPVSNISLSTTTATVKVGNNLELIATVTPNDATNKAVIWTSSDPGKATVINGVVTGVAEGTATITATSEDNSEFTASCEVTVIPNVAGVIEIPYTWTFNTLPDGWSADTATANSSNAEYGNGMTLTGAQRSSRFNASQNGPGGLSGCIQPNGASAANSPFLTIAIVPSAFTLTVKYSNTGNSEDLTRYVWAKVGDATMDGPGCVAGNASEPSILTWAYSGTGGTLELHAGGGASRVYEVTIETLEVPPLTSLSIERGASHTIGLNQPTTLTAIRTPAGATDEVLSWESADTDKVTVEKTDANTATITGIAATTTPVEVRVYAEDSNPAIEAVIAITVDASFVSVQSVDITGAATFGDQKYLWLPLNGTANLDADVTPPGATNPAVNWSSSQTTGAGGISVTNGALTAGNTASSGSPTWTIITAASGENENIKDTVKAVVLPAVNDQHDTGANWKHAWSFREPITGWMVYDATDTTTQGDTTMSTPATLASGLTLTASDFSDAPSGTQNGKIRWMPFQSASGGSSAGAIQTAGASLPVTVTGTGSSGDTTFNVDDPQKRYFLEIANVSVPFKITLRYSNTGGNPQRYPLVYVDGSYKHTGTGVNSRLFAKSSG